MSYTERYSEVHSLLGVINPASYNSVQDTGYVSFANYHRGVIKIHCGVIGGNLDIDIEQGTTTAGAGAKTFNSGSKDITKTATTDNNTVSVIEINSSEFDVNNGFDTLNVEVTPASAGIFSVEIWGIVPRFAPVGVANLDTITD